MGREF
jgi:hypothetical protein